MRALANVYVHLPFCIKKCRYCAFPVHAVGSFGAQQELYSSYLQFLSKEIRQSRDEWRQPLDTLYFGGGTPSLFQPQLLRKMVSQFSVDDSTEVTLQVMASDVDKLEDYRNIGVNRFSIGVQSLNVKLLRGVNRPPFDPVALQAALQKQTNYNIDVMLGLGESQQDRQEMLSFIERLRPPQATIYMLELNEGSYFHRHNYHFGKELPPTEQVIAAYRETCLFMDQLGYDHYEVSSFFRKDRPSPRHNRVYWQGNQEFAAFGMGATSLQRGLRQTRPTTLARYYRYVDGKIGMEQTHDETSRQEALTVKLMSRLRTKKGITYSQITEQFGSRVCEALRATATELHQLNPLLFEPTVRSSKIQLTTTDGFLACDQIVYKLLDSAKERG